MTEPFIAEIRIFAGNFAPTNWALCNGQLLPISQNTALFSLLGTNYGGNGTTTFGLPNMQGNSPMHAGQGQGLSQRVLGETGGEQAVTLQQAQVATHTHTVEGTAAAGNQVGPGNNAWGQAGRTTHLYAASSAPTNVQMHPSGTGVAGGNQPHNNMPPFLGLTFIIALNGIFPSRP